MGQQTEYSYRKNCEPPRMKNNRKKNDEDDEYHPSPCGDFCHLRCSFRPAAPRLSRGSQGLLRFTSDLSHQQPSPDSFAVYGESYKIVGEIVIEQPSIGQVMTFAQVIKSSPRFA